MLGGLASEPGPVQVRRRSESGCVDHECCVFDPQLPAAWKRSGKHCARTGEGGFFGKTVVHQNSMSVAEFTKPMAAPQSDDLLNWAIGSAMSTGFASTLVYREQQLLLEDLGEAWVPSAICGSESFYP